MNPLVISCSLNPTSRSARLALHAYDTLRGLTGSAELVDLRQTALPMCDGGKAYQHENVAPLAAKVSAAGPILLAVPVYNYDVNAAAKNLIELTGRAWTGKVVGFICTAGGQGSYMSVMSLANSLMLDFRCLIVPRFVYATGDHFEEGGTPGAPGAPVEAIVRRTDELCRAAVGLNEALKMSQASAGQVL
ncbi:MAG: NAD(P)H-dependent oxidoreductase [Phycisphaerales bacterium]